MKRAVTSIFKSQHVPGAAIAAVKGVKDLKDGTVLKEIIYGDANLQLRVSVKRTTTFQLASVTKVFTAAALMKLEGDGRVKMDAPVSSSWRSAACRTNSMPSRPEGASCTTKVMLVSMRVGRTAGSSGHNPSDEDSDWFSAPDETCR